MKEIEYIHNFYSNDYTRFGQHLRVGSFSEITVIGAICGYWIMLLLRHNKAVFVINCASLEKTDRSRNQNRLVVAINVEPSRAIPDDKLITDHFWIIFFNYVITGEARSDDLLGIMCNATYTQWTLIYWLTRIKTGLIQNPDHVLVCITPTSLFECLIQTLTN